MDLLFPVVTGIWDHLELVITGKQELDPTRATWKDLKSTRTRHFNIRYVFITDWAKMKEISIDWCPTKKTVVDFMTRPLQGSHIRKLRDYIIGRVICIKLKADVISLGWKASKKLVKKSKVNDKRRITVTGSKCHVKVMAQ